MVWQTSPATRKQDTMGKCDKFYINWLAWFLPFFREQYEFPTMGVRIDHSPNSHETPGVFHGQILVWQVLVQWNSLTLSFIILKVENGFQAPFFRGDMLNRGRVSIFSSNCKWKDIFLHGNFCHVALIAPAKKVESCLTGISPSCQTQHHADPILERIPNPANASH